MSNPHASPVITVAVMLLASCARSQNLQTSASTINVEPALTIGMSIEDLHDTAGRYVHHFTVKRASQTVRCVSAPVSQDPCSFYFVFVDGRLAKIAERPKIRFDIVEIDGRRVGRRIVNPKEDVESVLHARELSLQEAIEIAREKARRSHAIQDRYAEPLPIPLSLWKLREALSAPAQQREMEKHRKLVRQFDPMKVELGMSPDHVAEAFASKCVDERRVGEAVIRLYGDAKDVSTIQDPWVAVRFEDDLAVAIYSADFFDPKWRDN